MDAALKKLLDGVTPAKRKRDAQTMLEMMTRVTGEKPVVSGAGAGVGFGTYHYHYESGRQGDAPAAGFAPRKNAMVVYLMDGVGAHEDQLAKLGPHKATVGCIYIKDLDDVDLKVLERIVKKSYKTLTKSTYTARAREGGRK